jgi:hypothetical protein
MIANASVRNALMRLPADVKQRLAELPHHVHALQSLVEQIDEDRFAQTAAHPDATALLTVVYPLERAVEVVDRYVCDLAASAIRCGGLMVERPDENLRRLPMIGVTSRRRAEFLLSVHHARERLERPPDAAARRNLARAAAVLAREAMPFLGDCTAWLLAHEPDPDGA